MGHVKNRAGSGHAFFSVIPIQWLEDGVFKYRDISPTTDDALMVKE